MRDHSLVSKFHFSLKSGDANDAKKLLEDMVGFEYPWKLISSLRAEWIRRFDTALVLSGGRTMVSVIIPIYDREELLAEAIESILNQTYDNFELILVADGSPNGTLKVIESFKSHPKVKVYYFPISSGNAVRARNKGILESSGKYIAFLDSDDVATSNRLEVSVDILEQSSVDVVYGDWQAILDGTRFIPNIKDGQIVQSADFDFELLRTICIPCQSTVMVRKSRIIESGFIKTKLKYREDHEFWVRLAYFGARFCRIPEVLVKLRLHSGNNELNFISEDDRWATMVQQEFCIRGIIPKKIVFLLPSVGISGGIGVVFKHADLLMERGHDVTLFNFGPRNDGNWFPKRNCPIIHVDDLISFNSANIDLLFATEWSTVAHLSKFNAKRKLYFVQSDERRFHDDENKIAIVHSTYQMNLEYLTEAHWIRKMLKSEFSKNSYYVPNGLDTSVFYEGNPIKPRKPGRIRVLLEGPICIPFKGMADSYAAVADLDCEIWIVSSAGLPPDDWRVDKFFESVPFAEMHRVYSSCDIFLKMSRVEGFFGPPLEAMACGCAVVVGKVTGYDEYIVDEQNALVVEQGDVSAARLAVKKLIEDSNLRSLLVSNGFSTSKDWSWAQSARCMQQVVDGQG